MPLQIRPLSYALGAEITGIDLKQRHSDATIAEIRQAWVDHLLVLFPGQNLEPQEQIDFCSRFGTLDDHRSRPHWNRPDFPEINIVANKPLVYGGKTLQTLIADKWHTDMSFSVRSASASWLLAQVLPPIGGDTMFANMYLAYETLSDGYKRMLEGLRAVHSSRHIFGPNAAYHGNDLKDRLANASLAVQDAVHPVVIAHPITGRKALYVNPNFTVGIEGWTAEESRALFDHLFRHAVRPEFTCRFRWRNGSIAIWDNRCTWHLAINDYHGHRRLMHRITIDGTRLH
jgi:taurine dioxygenase